MYRRVRILRREEVDEIKAGNFNRQAGLRNIVIQGLGSIDFSNMDFRGVPFNNCIFEAVDFTNSLFEETSFKTINFVDCKFENANMHNSNFNACQLEKVAFSSINDTNGANLENAKFELCKIDECYFTATNMKNSSFVDDTNIIKSRFNNAILTDSSFEDSNIKESFFNDSECTNMKIENCYIYGTNFSDAIIENGSFTNSTLIRINFNNTNLRTVDFEDTELRIIYTNDNTILEGTIYDELDFSVSENNIHNLIYNGEVTTVRLQEGDTGYEDEAEDIEAEDDEDEDDINPHQPEGVAFEVHNAFDNMNVGQVLAFFDGLIQTPIQNYKPISSYVIAKFNNYIDNHFNDRDESWKNEQKRQLASIYEKFDYSGYKNDENIIKLMGRSVDYAFNQPEELVDLYVETYIQDNYFAYEYDPRMPDGDRRSCPKGIAERTLITLGETINIYCDNHEDGCNEQYQTLRNLLGLLPMYTYIQQWSEKIENNKADYEAMSVEQRKQDFIDFMKNIYNGFNNLTPRIEGRINQEAEKLGYVFESLEFGGGSKRLKKHKQNKGKTVKKTKKVKQVKKNTKKLVRKLKHKKTKVKGNKKTKHNKRK